IVNNDNENSPMKIIDNITSLLTKSDNLDNTSGIIDNPINISPISTIVENLPTDNENMSSDVDLSDSQVDMDQTQSTVNLNMDTPEKIESHADFSEIEGFSIDDNGSRVRVANESFESRNISDDLGSALKGVQTGELADKGLDQLSNFSGVNKSGLSSFFGSSPLFSNAKSQKDNESRKLVDKFLDFGSNNVTVFTLLAGGAIAKLMASNKDEEGSGLLGTLGKGLLFGGGALALAKFLPKILPNSVMGRFKNIGGLGNLLKRGVSAFSPRSEERRVGKDGK